MIYHLFALTLAFLVDGIIGDPPRWPHPVRWIGSLIAVLERRLNKGQGRKVKGVLLVFLVLLIVGGISWSLIYFCYQWHPIAGVAVETLFIATAIARKSLRDASLEVYEPLKNHDLQEARLKLSWIVGRDTESLDESEVTRGAVETVAENTSDGVTAPLFWAFIGGGTGALLYRAINTCDSMVGYTNSRYLQFGWASAKLDDVVNWIPARITSFLMIWSRRPAVGSRKEVWKLVLRDAPKHPSPNSGWCEAAVAGMLGIQLGGLNTYKGQISDRARMGNDLIEKKANHIIETNRILNRSSWLFLGVLWIGGMIVEIARTWF